MPSRASNALATAAIGVGVHLTPDATQWRTPGATSEGRRHEDDNGGTGLVYARPAQQLPLLRDPSGAAIPNPLGSDAASPRFVAAVENTTPSPGGADGTRGARTAGEQYRQLWLGPWRVIRTRALTTGVSNAYFQSLELPPLVAVMAQPLEPAWSAVCPVVWEGRSREASPIPIHGTKEKFSALQRTPSVVWGATDTLGASIPLAEPDRMEVFTLVIWMPIGGDFQEICWPGMSEAE